MSDPTTTVAPLTIGVQPWSYIQHRDGSRSALVGFVPTASPARDYKQPGSGWVTVRFDRHNEVLSIAPRAGCTWEQITAFLKLTEADRDELVLVSHDCTRETPWCH